MTSLKSLMTLALVLSLSAHQVSAEAIMLNDEILVNQSCELSDEAVATLVDVASLIEARKIAVPKGLRSVFAHLHSKHRDIPVDELQAGVDDASAVVRTYAAAGDDKENLLAALRDLRILTYTIPNNVAISGTFAAAKTAVVGTGLTVTSGGATVSAGGLTVSAGAATLGGTLAVTGASTLGGALTMNDNMTTTGWSRITGSGTALAVSNNATVGGTLVVSGASTLNSNMTATGWARLTGSGTGLAVSNNATVGGTLAVSGVSTLNGNLTCTGFAIKFPNIIGRTAASGTAVLVGTGGVLGTVSSSRRYKNDIQDLGDRSAALMQLRPVSFSYKSDDQHLTQFGLIAEEVEAVLPELVLYNQDNQPETVAYHVLPSLLLNEAIRQNNRMSGQDSRMSAIEQELASLRAQVRSAK